MEHLTEQNISEITTLIKAKGVEMEELVHDLVDHICCMIEERMEQGENYTSALDKTMNSFGNNGIRNIQEETNYLLTKNILAMRKTMHITGITAAILLLLGSIFKIQHWPGAGFIYILGAASLCLLFMPLFLAVRIKEKIGKLNVVSNVVGTIGAITMCFGILFKIMYWPFAGILMNTGGVLLLFIFLPLYIYSGFKSKQLKTSTIVPIIVAVAGFSLMFSLVKLRNSQDVTDAILNIQYTIYEDTESTLITNQSILKILQNDSITAHHGANEIAQQINDISEDLNFAIAQSMHQEIPEEKLRETIRLNYYSISNDMGDLAMLRKDERGLQDLVDLIKKYEGLYLSITGVKANLMINNANLESYLNRTKTLFPLGIVIHDLSLLNLQVQRLHSSLLQYYKGKVS